MAATPPILPPAGRADAGAGRGLVFDIQKLSLHDGSGTRTLVFLKGCPLRCRWCANPESQSPLPEVGHDADRCIGREPFRERCVCACPAEAFELYGEELSVADVLSVVEEDALFCTRSGGGLTVSGGEPLVQARFAASLLAAAHERGLHTAIETSGCGRWEDLERLCRHADRVFYDVKTLDPRRHREWTGVGNERILANLRRLCETFPALPVVVRTPVVPGFNDDAGSIRAIADFLETLPRPVRYELLPYHGFGESKYAKLGRDYALAGLEPPARAHLAELASAAGETRRRPS